MEIVDGEFTFDDVLLIPRLSDLKSRKDVSTDSFLTDNIKLHIPIVSANMDTITESAMAIAIAKAGGVGVIHRFNSIEEEAMNVEKVKREENIVIQNPYYVKPEMTLKELLELSREKNITGFPVVDDENKLIGIITKRDYEFEEDQEKRIEEMMTSDVIYANEGIDQNEAKKIMVRNKIEKLPLVDKDRKLVGMITLKDIKLSKGFQYASKDKKGRLIVGAAIGIGPDYLERAKALYNAGADFIVVDVANGYLARVQEVVKALKERFSIDVIAGNVATREGVSALKKAGADAVKVGIGPGKACLTRVVAGVGYPQLSAIIECSKENVHIVADGGIRKSADFAKAIAGGADTVMIGGLFAGTDETPGLLVTKEGKNYKLYRGMASINAYLDKETKLNEEIDVEGYTPEGTEMLVPYRGPVQKILNDLIGGLRSAMTYLNASDIESMHKNAKFVRLTESAKYESKYLK